MAVQDVVEWYPLPEVVGDELKWQMNFASFETDSLLSGSSTSTSVSTLRPPPSPTLTRSPQKLLATPNADFSPLVLDTGSEQTSQNGSSLSPPSITTHRQPAGNQRNTSISRSVGRPGITSVINGAESISQMKSVSLGPSPMGLPPVSTHDMSITSILSTSSEAVTIPAQRGGLIRNRSSTGAKAMYSNTTRDRSITRDVSSIGRKAVHGNTTRDRSSADIARDGSSTGPGNGGLTKNRLSTGAKDARTGAMVKTLSGDTLQSGHTNSQTPHSETKPGDTHHGGHSQTPRSETKPGDTQQGQKHHLERKPGDTPRVPSSTHQTLFPPSGKSGKTAKPSPTVQSDPHTNLQTTSFTTSTGQSPQLRTRQLDQLWKKYLSTPPIAPGNSAVPTIYDRLQHSVTPCTSRLGVGLQDERGLQRVDKRVSKLSDEGYKQVTQGDESVSNECATDWWIQRRIYLNDRSIQTTPSLENQTPFRRHNCPDPISFSISRPSPARQRVENPPSPAPLDEYSQVPPSLSELSLQEALSLFHPRFIQHSQARQHTLQQHNQHTLQQHNQARQQQESRQPHTQQQQQQESRQQHTLQQHMRQHRRRVNTPEENRLNSEGEQSAKSQLKRRAEKCVGCGRDRLSPVGGGDRGREGSQQKQTASLFFHFDGSSTRPKQSMKAMYLQSNRYWSQLSEVQQKAVCDRRMAQAATNRLRVKLYQKEVLARMRRKLKH